MIRKHLKNDLILLGCILGFALIIFVFGCYVKSRDYQSLYVTVMIKNEKVDSFLISDSVKKTYYSADGYNTLIIADNVAYVASSDCNNQICVNSSPICEYGQSIVCLPHEFAIIISDKR